MYTELVKYPVKCELMGIGDLIGGELASYA